MFCSTNYRMTLNTVDHVKSVTLLAPYHSLVNWLPFIVSFGNNNHYIELCKMFPSFHVTTLGKKLKNGKSRLLFSLLVVSLLTL